MAVQLSASTEAAPDAGALSAPTGPAATLAGADRFSAYMDMMAAEGGDTATTEAPDAAAPAAEFGEPPTADDVEVTFAEQQPTTAAPAAQAPVAAPAAETAPAVMEGDEPPDTWAPPQKDVLAALDRISKGAAREVRGAMFRDQQMKLAGMTPEHARQLKEAGFTPERALRTLQRFPTVAHEEQVLAMAESAQKFENDFKFNPDGLVDGLQAWDPDAFVPFAAKVAQAHERLNPGLVKAKAEETWERNVRNTFKQARKWAQAEDDPELKAAADKLEMHIFNDVGGDVRPGIPADPRTARELEQLRLQRDQLQQQQQRIQQSQVQNFQGSVVSGARQALWQHVNKTLADLNPTGLNEQARRDAARDAYLSVEAALQQNPTILGQIENRFRNGRMDRPHAEQVFTYILGHATPLVPSAIAAQVKRFRAYAGAPAPQPAPTARTAAAPAPRPVLPAGGAAARPSTAAQAAKQSVTVKAPGWRGMLDALTDYSAARTR